jgi:hypothetical protein
MSSTIANKLLKAIPNPFTKSGHDLIVLRLALDMSERHAQAVLDLTTYGKISDAGKRTWRVALHDMGLSESIEPERAPQPYFPLQVQEGLRASMALMDPAADLPLWLNLVRPYGYLGMLPWERLLGALLDRPVLRLPDFLERPRENADVLEAAIIFDPPAETPPDKAFQQLKSIVEQMLAAASRVQTRINIFTTSVWSAGLQNISTDSRVRFHAPENAVALAVSSATQSEKPSGRRLWLEWISAAVDGRSLDSIHFVGRAVATTTRTGLLVSSSPVPDGDEARLSLVDVADIGATLTRLGAWAAIFSPPLDGSESLAMAYVADAFAHSRPGAVLYLRARPEDDADLGQSLRFLFSSNASRPPKVADGFIYCQPSAVSAHAGFHGSFTLDSLTRGTDLVGKTASFVERAQAIAASYIPLIAVPDIRQAPNWASAAQRYIESVSLDQLRLNATDVLFTKADAPAAPPGQDAPDSQNEALKETLSDIQKVVGSYLRKFDSA